MSKRQLAVGIREEDFAGKVRAKLKILVKVFRRRLRQKTLMTVTL